VQGICEVGRGNYDRKGGEAEIMGRGMLFIIKANDSEKKKTTSSKLRFFVAGCDTEKNVRGFIFVIWARSHARQIKGNRIQEDLIF